MMRLKCCTQYASKFGKLSSGHRTGKRQFLFQSPRMFKLPNKYTHFACQQGNAQNSSSQASAVHEPRNSRCTSWVRENRGTRDQIANILWIIEKAKEFQKNIYFCFIDYAKDFDFVDNNKLQKIFKEMGISDHLTRLL